ncbi:MAG: aminoacyl-tRNA hydrolase [Acidobacteriota bacterium]|nr:aminoacyl-tRNA hydrolase [Acidobacteriota bacterium]
MRIILGLGNPGREYRETRHNVGFEVVERLCLRHGISLTRMRHRSRYGTGRIGGLRVLLATPLTYMNLSGEAARPLLDYHGLSADELIVVHDEADLSPGIVRIKVGGGIAGHNGLRSIVRHLGTNEFTRVRIGIGRPRKEGTDMERHVLARPTSGETRLLEEGLDLAVDAVECLLAEGAEAAMRQFHTRSDEDR